MSRTPPTVTHPVKNMNNASYYDFICGIRHPPLPGPSALSESLKLDASSTKERCLRLKLLPKRVDDLQSGGL